MRVTINDNRYLRLIRAMDETAYALRCAIIDDVRHQNFATCESQNHALGKLADQREAIDVTIHRRDRRDAAQLGNDLRFADVSGVQDVIDAGEEIKNSRMHFAVCVGDDAYLHKHFLLTQSHGAHGEKDREKLIQEIQSSNFLRASPLFPAPLPYDLRTRGGVRVSVLIG